MNEDRLFELTFQLGHKKFGTGDNLRTPLAQSLIAEEVEVKKLGQHKLGNRHKKVHNMFSEAIEQGNVIMAINDAGDKTPYLLLSAEDQKKLCGVSQRLFNAMCTNVSSVATKDAAQFVGKVLAAKTLKN